MKLTIYNGEKKIVDLYENMLDVKVNGDNVSWRDGALKGIKMEYLLLNDDVETQDEVTDELISQDLKAKYKEISLEDENRQLRERVEATEMAVLSLLELM
ncbi:hypothetical protein ACQCT3_17935 [Sutcliffiella horikoshii]|uniref:hypothetical protein n=1 Tax=Sutcliffiella horikoshii TaxID=79883 RepID=UPI003CF36B3D